MEEQWLHIEDFPGYMVSDWGNVRTPDGRQLVKSPVQYNIPTVGLRLPDESRTMRRAVPLLVAKAFLEEPEREDFDTPIHLDGNRENARADNLVWRPRWFAIKFHKDRRSNKVPEVPWRIICVENGETFASIREASTYYGLLDSDIFLCLHDPAHWAFPHNFHFVEAD